MTTYQIDPRRWAILHPRATACIVAAITLLMAWGNYAVPKRGLLDDIILPDGNIYKEADRYVREKIADGFAPGEIEPFVLEYPRGIQTPGDLQRIRDLTERVKQMGNAGVLSLSETPAYHDNGETLSADPYIPAVVPADFDIAAWKRRVARRSCSPWIRRNGDDASAT